MRLLALAALGLLGCGRFGFDEVARDEPGTGPDGGVPILGDDDGGSGGGGGDSGAVPMPDGATAVPPNCFDVPCSKLVVDGAAFDRDNNTVFPARVSSYALDRHEVTVARFRQFVNAGFGTQSTAPDQDDGALSIVPDSGWKSSWNSILPSSTSTFVAGLTSTAYATYTASPGANEQMPVVRVTWYEAFAFCIWDGGRLPTVAEHESAAYGGEQQRLYPWGSTWDATKVAMGSLAPIGSRPAGDARWGHADLVGNADEWAFDFFNNLPQPCNDCAQLVPQSTPTRVLLGGSYMSNTTDYAQTWGLHGMGPNQRNGTVGFRCAREI